MITDGYQVAQESWSSRAWRRLGFGYCHAERPETAEHGIASDTFLCFDWRDRLRVLLSGTVMVQTFTATDVRVSRVQSTSAVGVLPPTWQDPHKLEAKRQRASREAAIAEIEAITVLERHKI